MSDPATTEDEHEDRDFALEAVLKMVIDIMLDKGLTSQTDLNLLLKNVLGQFREKQQVDSMMVIARFLEFVGDPQDPTSRERVRRLAKGPTEGTA